jgi:ribosomal protein S27AE
MHGHHINSPFWNLEQRGTRTEATYKLLITADEIKSLPVEEVNRRINADFVYDDFAWQKENRIRVTYKDRAKGLHSVLYQCPNCRAEYRMASEGERIRCEACGKAWTMSEYGELAAVEGPTEFSHIPDWYEWERANVRKEVDEGRYHFSAPVTVRSLPNAKGYVLLGDGHLVHDMHGFHLKGEYEGEPYRLHKSVGSMYSCHIEYNYLGKFGDCVDLNTLTDTFYVYPKDVPFSVTKIALATEELYKHEAEHGTPVAAPDDAQPAV